MAISNEVMNLLGENPATELEDINQEIADLQKDILAGVKAHRDITGLAERVQQLRSRKTEIEAGQAVEERDKERIKALRESIEKSKDKVLAYDEKLVRNFIICIASHRFFAVSDYRDGFSVFHEFQTWYTK